MSPVHAGSPKLPWHLRLVFSMSGPTRVPILLRGVVWRERRWTRSLEVLSNQRFWDYYKSNCQEKIKPKTKPEKISLGIISYFCLSSVVFYCDNFPEKHPGMLLTDSNPSSPPGLRQIILAGTARHRNLCLDEMAETDL